MLKNIDDVFYLNGRENIPMAHLFDCPVLLSFTGMNLIMPYTISVMMKAKTATRIDSKGTMVETPRRAKIESTTVTRDDARQAHTVCIPIGIFAKATFIACRISTEITLSSQE